MPKMRGGFGIGATNFKLSIATVGFFAATFACTLGAAAINAIESLKPSALKSMIPPSTASPGRGPLSPSTNVTSFMPTPSIPSRRQTHTPPATPASFQCYIPALWATEPAPTQSAPDQDNAHADDPQTRSPDPPYCTTPANNRRMKGAAHTRKAPPRPHADKPPRRTLPPSAISQGSRSPLQPDSYRSGTRRSPPPGAVA